MLTTASAIADVNFTEKTRFLYDRNNDDESVVNAIYLNHTDANGITLSSSDNTLSRGSFENGMRKWPDNSCRKGNNSYNTSYFQISSSQKAIKSIYIYESLSEKKNILIVGWKGTIAGTADYYKKVSFSKGDYSWLEFDLSDWKDVKTVRLYGSMNSGSDLIVDSEPIYSESSFNLQIYGIQVGIDTENISTSISTYGVAAFSSASALDFTNVTECSAFYADSYANGVLHLTKATGVVPAHFGLLLCSTNEGAVSFSIPIATAEQVAACTNKFVATDESTYTPTTSTEALALGVKNGKAGFYYVGAGVTVPQYRFYLPAPSVRGAKNLTLDFDNATGITSIPFNDPATQNSVGESAIPSQTTQPTDLLGRPCPTPRAGALYIKGGKAYLTPAR